MIECKNIHFGYSKDPLFNDLSANFENGHIYGLLGKNGAGKTTLLKCIAGLLHLKSGEIDVLGRKSIKKEPEILKDIFFFPENFFLPSLSGEKYYKLYCQFYPNFNEEYFLKTCVDFEIQLDKNLRTLSFGQKKKFYLAFGLSTFAKIMLLDEPTNGLDIPSKTAVRKKIAESLTENQTFIISTHQVRDLSQLFDYIIILHNGKIIFHNSIDYITDNYSIKIKTINQNNEKEEIESIYYEESTIGKIYLVKNKGNNSNIDLEFFFDAAISNPNSIF